MLDATVTTAQFRTITGIGPGHVQHWIKAGILKPGYPGIGHQRHFSLRDALQARFTLELTRRGLRLRDARKIMRRVIPEFIGRDCAGDLVVLLVGTAREMAGRVYLTHPRAQLATRAAAIQAITAHQGPAYVIALGEISDELRAGYLRTGTRVA